MSDDTVQKHQGEFKSREEERINRIFSTALKPEAASAPTTPYLHNDSNNDDDASSKTPDLKMMSEEERRLGAHYLETDNKVGPPKPKWNSNTAGAKSADVYNTNSPKKELASLNIHRPSFQKPSETEKLLKSGLSEEEIIAKKKKELEQKAYLKKKKDDAKDSHKWAQKEVQAAGKEKAAWEIKEKEQREAREREIKAAEERRAAEARFQQEREEAMRKEFNRHANITDSGAPKKTSSTAADLSGGGGFSTAVNAAGTSPSSGSSASTSSSNNDNDDDASAKFALPDNADTAAKREEARLKARWII